MVSIGNGQFFGNMRAGRNQDGIVAIFKQTRDITNAGVQLKLNPLVQDALD